LQHAAYTDEELRKKHPDRSPVPGLHLSLANACRNPGTPTSRVWDEYLKAVSGFIYTLREREALNALTRILHTP
jgi:hypothetical protein